MAESLAETQALPFDINILTGPLSQKVLQQGQPKGQIRLAMRSLPSRGTLSYEGRQRVKTTWYPGNTTATQQVLGPVEEPSTISGVWKDKFLGDGAARLYCDLFDVIRRAGPVVEVVWGAGFLFNAVFGKQFTRRGIITRVKFTPDRAQDIAWEIEFTWASQGETVASTLYAAPTENPREGITGVTQNIREYAAAITALTDKPFATLTGFTGTFLDSVDNLTNAALELQEVIGRTTVATDTIQTMPRYVIERSIAVAQQTIFVQQQMEASIIGLWYTLTWQPVDDAIRFLSALNDMFGVVKVGDTTRYTATATRDSLEGMLTPTILAEVRPPAGTDLRDLALQWYGDPDEWWQIAQYNGLTTSEVPTAPMGPSDSPFATQPIRIPVRQNNEANTLAGQC